MACVRLPAFQLVCVSNWGVYVQDVGLNFGSNQWFSGLFCVQPPVYGLGVHPISTMLGWPLVCNLQFGGLSWVCIQPLLCQVGLLCATSGLLGWVECASNLCCVRLASCVQPRVCWVGLSVHPTSAVSGWPLVCNLQFGGLSWVCIQHQLLGWPFVRNLQFCLVGQSPPSL